MVMHNRVTSPDFGAQIVEMGGGEGNVVELLAVHWSFELWQSGSTSWISLAISSNPEHLLAPPIDLAFFQADPALYGRATWIMRNNPPAALTATTLVIPLYEMIRPRKQLFVWGLINGDSLTGMTGELYYRPVVMSIHRKSYSPELFRRSRRTEPPWVK